MSRISISKAPIAASSPGNAPFAVTPYPIEGIARSIVTRQNLAAGALILGKVTNVASSHYLYDTARGNSNYLRSNSANAEASEASGATEFTASGVDLSVNSNINNGSGNSSVLFSWLEQVGFLDIVSENGTGGNRTFAHALGIPPKLIIARERTRPMDWYVYHDSVGSTKYLPLNDTSAAIIASDAWNNTPPTSSNFYVGGTLNDSGMPLIYYVFGEKSGFSKFGSFLGSAPVDTGLSQINALLVKRTDAAGDWYLFYRDSGVWYYVTLNTSDPRAIASSLISVSGGVFTPTGILATGNHIFAAFK
jgi:hypothetical protein